MADRLRWFEQPDRRMPWIEAGRPDGPLVLALPGLSDGLMPLSEVGPHVLGTARSTRRLPFRVVTVSHRHPDARATVTTRELAEDAAAFIEAPARPRRSCWWRTRWAAWSPSGWPPPAPTSSASSS